MRARFLGALLLLLAAPPARAAGYFTGARGARASGRAGAFTAKADDLSAVALNPAGLARIGATLIQGGNRVSYNAHAFQRAPTLDWGSLEAGIPPFVEFANVDNQRPWQLLEPLLGVVSNLGLPGWGFALSAYAPAGVARQEFPVNGGQRYMMLQRQAVILAYNASAAYSHRETFGVGITLQWLSVPRLTYELVIDANRFPGEVNPVSSELDLRARVSGSDTFTPQAILGAWYRPVEALEFGISAQVIPTHIRTNSTLELDPLSPEIEEGVELRRDGEPANDVRLSLPLPLTGRVGVRYRHLDAGVEVFDLELDLGYETWSRVDRFSMRGDGLVANLLAQRVDVNAIEIEKNWRDTLSVQLGGDVPVIAQALTLRGGVFYESATAPLAYAHVDFASGAQLGYALGASVFATGLELALAYEFRYQAPLELSEGEARFLQEVPSSQCQPPFTDPDTCNPRYLGQRAPAVNAGTYRAHSHALSVDVLYRF